jgi:hypothetical protein
VRIARHGEREAIREGRAPISLLDRVRQLVGEEPAPCMSGRRKLSCPKYHLPADDIGARAQRASGSGGFGVSVHPNLREVVAETRLEEFARRRVERAAG